MGTSKTPNGEAFLDSLSLSSRESYYIGVLKGIELGATLNHPSQSDQAIHHYQEKLQELRNAQT